MPTFGTFTWGSETWGNGANASIPFFPIFFSASNKKTPQSVMVTQTATIDIGIDFSSVLANGEFLNAHSFVTSDPLLIVTSTALRGIFSLVRLTNNMAEGQSAFAICKVTTSFGRVLSRNTIIVSDIS
jgi:hypothetical protein